MLNTIKLGILLMCCLMTAACVGDTGIRELCEKSIKEYNRMLRWRELDAAGALYMVPEQREAFATTAGKINKKDLSITDFRILTMECLPEKESGSALVEFDYFILPSNRIKTLTYKQDWVYYEINEKKDWKVKSALPVFK